jgi:hypothetical protein
MCSSEVEQAVSKRMQTEGYDKAQGREVKEPCARLAESLGDGAVTSKEAGHAFKRDLNQWQSRELSEVQKAP